MPSKTIVLVVLMTLGSLCVDAISRDAKEPKKWWKDTFIYQIYPRSFKDSDGNGVGDLNGITSKLEHLVDLNVSALWLSPIYKSPMVDFGYDISNFTDIDPIFGNLNDFTKLTAKAKSLGLRVLMDFVPNHSSDQHPWFQASIRRIKPYDEYYIWQDAKMVNGTRQPPNNWLNRFGGSSWEWNSQRGQYYLHQFTIGQPDLNYRSPALDLEMKNALTFWLDRGVDGFRIDAINFMFEDSRLLDEPVIGGGDLPPDDWNNLDHIYTMDQHDTYLVLKSWRKLVDEHAQKANGTSEAKILLTEAYTTLGFVMKYYEYGIDVPFNFMFMSDLNNNSRPVDFKRLIDGWMNAMPKGYSANWVVGNHDNHRAASRFGRKRADQLSMLSAVLPGVGIVYNGDEIGMEDIWLSYNDTVDPAGCNAGPDRYNLTSRDPARTPFQWDSSVSSGFSTSEKTWLPVNPNYKSLNLAAQKMSAQSHYSVFKKLVTLKRQSIINNGSMEVILVTEKVLGVVRRLDNAVPVVLLINFSESAVTVDASSWMNIPKRMSVYVSSVDSKIPSGLQLDTSILSLPGAASIILFS